MTNLAIEALSQLSDKSIIALAKAIKEEIDKKVANG